MFVCREELYITLSEYSLKQISTRLGLMASIARRINFARSRQYAAKRILFFTFILANQYTLIIVHLGTMIGDLVGKEGLTMHTERIIS
ncbi:hypothetical protein JTE90_028811 [Oedothorax gibbosus]|uniref:Uncharacterized protein n=1 Tax=Oedothorax gibbosus TaxID=931172 RepID=A0AAV6VWK9_9ARAC|nr:hypothetical protein JTE90_028811 [Oedothorax gibbosus]